MSQASTAIQAPATLKNNPVITTVEGARGNFKMRLPKGIDPDKFFLGLLTAIQKSKATAPIGKSLADCDPKSVLLAAYEAAELGCSLSPALALGWLIPYGKEANFQPSYRFFIQRAYTTGDVKTIFAEVVYKEDQFDREFAPRRVLTHRPKGDRIMANRVGSYAYIEFADGTVDWEYLTAEQIERHRNASKQPNSMKWVQFWEEGWRITPIRVLAKRLPLKSRELEELVELANRTEETELNLDAEAILEPTAPRRAEPQAKEQPKEQPKQEAAKGAEPGPEQAVSEREPGEEQPQAEKAQAQPTMFGGNETDPFVTPEEISQFWPKAFATQATPDKKWNKAEVTALVKDKFGVEAIKELRKSQFEKLIEFLVAGKK